MRNFEQRLTGGHPNSLGNTVEVVEEVLENRELFDELFHCYFSQDEIVRLRVSNAMKRICREDKTFLVPYIDRFLTDIAAINQASTQWTLANLFLYLQKEMSPDQKTSAKEIMKRNLINHDDWIVLNNSMETLGQWSKKDNSLKEWMLPQLKRLSQDPRKTVAKRATKFLNQFT